MAASPPNGVTPPAPGLEREEPELGVEEHDIPPDDGKADHRPPAAADEDRPARDVERE